jgi:catechol 2,3-dioxygenase
MPQTQEGAVEYVEVSLPRVHNLHHVELNTPRLEESVDFFKRVLGLIEVSRDEHSVYLRAFGEWCRHSLILTKADAPGLAHMAWQVAEPEHLERYARRLESAGVQFSRQDGGAELGQGESLRLRSNAGHTIELFYEFERAEPFNRSKLRNQPERYLAQGIGVRRLDHVNVMAADVNATREWLTGTLGFKLREAVRLNDGTDIGVWMSVTSQVHDIAVMKTEAPELDGGLHHIAYYVDTPEGILRAADMFAEEGTVMEAGPGKHGLTQAFFVYVFEPGGNRVELFSGGYPIHNPDWEPIIWTEEELQRSIVWYGAPLPETFFMVGT